MDLWLYPGAALSVNSLTKVALVAAAAGETPPPGATVIPPQSPLPVHAAMIRQAQEANTAVAAEAVHAQAMADSMVPPPWEVTFTEKR